MEKYLNRMEAGKILAHSLKNVINQNVIVLGLPRGGVPVAFEIAKLYSLPLDVFIVRKLGVPGHEELAFGALATKGTTVFNDEVIQDLGLSQKTIQPVIEKETQELARREGLYRGNEPFPNVKNKTVILVDDGIATGATLRVAIVALRRLHPKQLVVAIPVAAKESYEKIRTMVDEIVCPIVSSSFYAVGQWYEEFGQTSDEEVSDLLTQGKKWRKE